LTEPVRADLEKLSRDEIRDKLEALAGQAYEAREQLFGDSQMRKMERWVMLQVIDSKWKDHLYAMDHLREGIGYRVYGQQDPLVEYQHEAYQMFQEMIQAIRTETVELIYRIQPIRSESIARVLTPTQFIHPDAQSVAASLPEPAPKTPPVIDPQDITSMAKSALGSAESSQPVHRSEPKVGRNDPCPCGSDKKFKKCHGA
jgi:preprotein translocase subunit SecA